MRESTRSRLATALWVRASVDLVHFGGLCDAGKWDSLQGMTIHGCFTRALKAFQKHRAKTVRFPNFATHVEHTKAFNAFLTDESAPNNAKANLSSAKDSPSATKFFTAVSSHKELTLPTSLMRIAV